MNRSKRPARKGSNNLNDQIMNYYHRFGKNRDLEKYLRLLSSSEGSLSMSTPDPENTTHCFDSKESAGDNLLQQDDDNGSGNSGNPELKVKGTNSKKKHDDIKKSYTFNCESNIAITIPYTGTVSMPELSAKISKYTEECYSQTEFDEIEGATGEDQLPTQTPLKLIEKIPESNIKSTNKRLEWDSLGDVGYNKTSKNQKSSLISTLERSVLKDFFADKGIEINFSNNLNKQTTDPLSEIQEEPLTIPISSSQGAIPKGCAKTKWRETLESFKNKYSSSPMLSASHVNSKDLSKFENISNNRHSTPKTISLEKFCQTSLIKKESQEIQCNFSNEGSIRSAFDVGSMTSQSSFEYIPQAIEKENTNKENNSPKTPTNSNEQQKLRESVAKLLDLQKDSMGNRKTSNEVALGVKLLCSLIDSKKMNDDQKKNLVQKIITKITKCQNKDINTGTRSTTRSTSICSSFSTQSAISENANEFNRKALPAEIKPTNQPIKSKMMTDLPINSKRSAPIHASMKNRKIPVNLAMSGVQSLLNSNSTNSIKSDLANSRSKSLNTIPTCDLFGKKLSENTKRRIGSEKELSNTSVKKLEDKSSQVNVNSLVKLMKNIEIKDIADKNSVPTKDGKSSDVENKSETSEDLETMREWLAPLTRSEFKYDVEMKNKIAEQEMPIDIGGGGDFISKKQPIKNAAAIDKNKQTHLTWIEMQIKRLEDLKHLLTDKMYAENVPKIPAELTVFPVTNVSHRNRKYDKVASTPKCPCGSGRDCLLKHNNSKQRATASTAKTVHDRYCKCGTCSSSSCSHQQPSMSSRKKQSTCEEDCECDDCCSTTSSSSSSKHIKVCREMSETEIVNKKGDYKCLIKRDKDHFLFDEENRRLSDPEEIEAESVTITEEKKFPKSNYMNICCNCNCQIKEKRRSKLDTPHSVEYPDSVRSFAKQKKDAFISKYKKAHAHDYDCPAESVHYSEPRPKNANLLYSKKPRYSSAISSEISSTNFMSSNSISIPNAGDFSTPTTTHQYDRLCGGVAIQTSDSLRETSPFFGTLAGCNCGNPTNCTSMPRKTHRVYKKKNSNDKKSQAQPRSIAYVLQFDEENTTTSADDKKKKKSKDKQHQTCGNCGNCGKNCDCCTYTTDRSCKCESLEDHFKKKRPKSYTKSRERQEVLHRMQSSRQERHQKIREIVENTSFESVNKKLDELPPPVIKSTRIFTTKEMKNMTKRKRFQFAEEVAKIDNAVKERKKRGNKVLADIFNMRLRKRAHEGKICFGHSETVI